MIVVVFIFGIIIGSFLNAVIFRLHTGEPVLFGRSHCVHCKHELAPIDLIPLVSFLQLSGKCRYCGKKISWQYPIVELITALSFVLLAYNLSPITYNLALGSQLVFICFLIIIGTFDFKYYLILDKVVYPALALAFLWNIWQDATTHHSVFTSYFAAGVLGALLVAGFFGLQYYISKGRWIGLGDVKLGLFLGMLLGLRLSLVMLIMAYFAGAVVGVGLIISKKKTFSSKLPFGVFLSFSAILTVLYGTRIADWYFKLIGF